MKKITAIILSGLMLFSLMACAKTAPETKESAAETTATAAETSETTLAETEETQPQDNASRIS